MDDRTKRRQALISAIARVLVDFGEIANDIVGERTQHGRLPHGLAPDAMDAMIAQYEEQLEHVTSRMIAEEVERIGRTDELEQMLDTAEHVDEIILYLSRTIPNSTTVILNVVEHAKNEMIGEDRCQTLNDAWKQSRRE